MDLFDNFTRTYMGVKEARETEFEFLNRSAREYFVSSRRILEHWFSDYPEEHKKDLRGSFRSKRNQQHRGAFFELYCHALLRAHGYVTEVHPAGDPTKSSTPDFLVSKDGVGLFYLECTLAADRRVSEAQERQLDELNEYLNEKLSSADFFVGMEVSEAPTAPVPLKQVKTFLEEQLEELDPQVIATEETEMGFSHEWVWSDGNWRVVFWPILKHPEARGSIDGRSVGMGVYSPETVEPEVPLQQALKDKAGGKYGNLGLPYVIAVNATDEFTHVEDVRDALFGPLHVVYDPTSGQTYSKHKPDEDTLWLSRDLDPKNRRVSAVLVSVTAKATNLASSKLLGLFHNPWALRPLDSELWDGSSHSLDPSSRTIRETSGKDLWDTLQVTPPG